MASHLLRLLIVLPCIYVQAKGSLSPNFFCPLNGSLPACDEQFRQSNFSSTFESIDSLINLFEVMDSKQHMAILCSDFDTYRDLMNCSSPGLAACQPDTLQRLSLVPDTDRWIEAMRYMCDRYQDMNCDPSMLSGFAKPTSTCLEDVRNDSASVNNLLHVTDDTETIVRFCRLNENIFDCLQPEYHACGTVYNDVFSRMSEGIRPPPCDVASTTLPSVSPPSTSEKSGGITLTLSQLNQFLYLALLLNSIF